MGKLGLPGDDFVGAVVDGRQRRPSATALNIYKLRCLQPGRGLGDHLGIGERSCGRWRQLGDPHLLQEHRRCRLVSVHELAGKRERLAKYQLSRRDYTRFFWRGPQSQQHPGEMIRPITCRQLRPERVLELAVAALYHPISFGVLSSGKDMLHSQLLAQGRPDRGGELRSSVLSDARWHSKTAHSAAEEGIGDSGPLHVVQGNGL